MTKLLLVGHYSEIIAGDSGDIQHIQIESFQEETSALAELEKEHYDVVIKNITHDDGDYSAFFTAMKTRFPSTRCMAVKTNPSFDDSVAAIKGGADDFASLPLSKDKLCQWAKTDEHAPVSDNEFIFDGVVGKSVEMQKVYAIVKKVAAADSTALITGESGTGKELIARAIHQNSRRRDEPMVIINCGSIPGELLESELFGHEKGAFTGAHRSRPGRFELADGGTIFLDEIGDMSPELQVKLLRVIQEKTFERIGGVKSITVDIRIISATNKNLKESVKEGTFREDLFYRLNVIPVQMPPLRNRRIDIPQLVDFFITQLDKRNRWGKKIISEAAMKALENYHWSGNIRELENIIERVSVLVDADIVELADLPESISGQAHQTPEHYVIPGSGMDFNEAIEYHQKQLIIQALSQSNGVKSRAAELLNMKRTTLVEKIKKMNITP